MPDGFWKESEWKAIFTREIVKVNALLKMYEPEDIQKAVLKNKYVKSYFNKQMPYYCEEEKNKRIVQEKINKANEQVLVINDTKTLPISKSNKVSQLDKLRNLDD